MIDSKIQDSGRYCALIIDEGRRLQYEVKRGGGIMMSKAQPPIVMTTRARQCQNLAAYNLGLVAMR
jgi:hypothetical protein